MKKPTEIDLPAILQGCRKKHREAQHLLYKLYYGYAMSIAIRYVKDEATAISVVNDAFMKVYKYIKTFDDNHAFKPWFRRIVVNTSITSLEKQRKAYWAEEMDEAKDIADREEILSRISYEELIGLVQSLTASYRAVFNMYVIDGFKHDEIAKTLGISVSTSKSNLVRARQKLRQLLRDELNITHV